MSPPDTATSNKEKHSIEKMKVPPSGDQVNMTFLASLNTFMQNGLVRTEGGEKGKNPNVSLMTRDGLGEKKKVGVQTTSQKLTPLTQR